MRAIALLLFVAPLAAQVTAVCGPVAGEVFSRSIFDRKTASQVQHWSCVIENKGPEAATVTEADLQGFSAAAPACRRCRRKRCGSARVRSSAAGGGRRCSGRWDTARWWRRRWRPAR